ncbi:MAG: hypothetical protein COS84_03590 [Armatimonadetes bacterium CG07_land_8_20_14_0_80_40_9]|nr:MAG: hypothetical protein COS84_03590 [Armatimonadetes bacterium CG07_land_8_20_14_0_80_40_9]
MPKSSYPVSRIRLEDEKVSAVIIATPTNSHSKVAIDAGQAGKHIFCEKPMAHSSWLIADARNGS